MFSIYLVGSSSWNKYVNRVFFQSRGTLLSWRGHDGRQARLDLSYPHLLFCVRSHRLASSLFLDISRRRRTLRPISEARRPCPVPLNNSARTLPAICGRRKGTSISICTNISRNSVCDVPGNYDCQSPNVIAPAISIYYKFLCLYNHYLWIASHCSRLYEMYPLRIYI